MNRKFTSIELEHMESNIDMNSENIVARYKVKFAALSFESLTFTYKGKKFLLFILNEEAVYNAQGYSCFDTN